MKLAITAVLLSFSSFATTIPLETFSRLQKLYPEQSSSFLQVRLQNAPGIFDKWRSFPSYYYELLSRHPEGRSLSRPGLCAGDAHVENFGFIWGTPPVFTLNDLDDVAPCSLDADLMRLFIGHRFVHPELDAKVFLNQYQTGLSGKACSAPVLISDLQKDSIKKAKGLSKKNKTLVESRSCHGEYAFLTPQEAQLVEAFHQTENTRGEKKDLIHACSRTKLSGGSAGGKRFVIFRQDAAGEVDGVELKPLQRPAPLFASTLSLNQRYQIFSAAVMTFVGKERASDYYAIQLGRTLYQRRPLWAGNEEVKLEELAKLDGASREAVMLYEACRLGSLHGQQNLKRMALQAEAWERLALSLQRQFMQEFGLKRAAIKR